MYQRYIKARPLDPNSGRALDGASKRIPGLKPVDHNNPKVNKKILQTNHLISFHSITALQSVQEDIKLNTFVSIATLRN